MNWLSCWENVHYTMLTLVVAPQSLSPFLCFLLCERNDHETWHFDSSTDSYFNLGLLGRSSSEDGTGKIAAFIGKFTGLSMISGARFRHNPLYGQDTVFQAAQAAGRQRMHYSGVHSVLPCAIRATAMHIPDMP